MMIEFRAADRVLSVKALGIYEKGVEAAVAACGKVYVDTMALQSAGQSVTAARSWMARMDEMEPGEARDVEIPHDLAATLRTAASVYMTQLGKLAEKETDMLVPLDNTRDLMSRLRSLADRLAGQTDIVGALADTIDSVASDPDEREESGDSLNDRTTIAFSHGGKTSKPITMTEFEKRVEKLKAR